VAETKRHSAYLLSILLLVILLFFAYRVSMGNTVASNSLADATNYCNIGAAKKAKGYFEEVRLKVEEEAILMAEEARLKAE
jgi:hypothetical protein